LRRAATAKKQEKIANLKTAPKPENKNKNHFKPISGQANTFFWRLAASARGKSIWQKSYLAALSMHLWS
jgi:hypothetical protein